MRVEKHFSGGSKEQFYYDGAFVIEDQDGSQNLVREYMQGGQYIDEIIAVKTSGNYYYYMYDLRFNEYGFVDSTGSVVERAKYDGFGKRALMDASYSTITTPIVDQYYSYTGQRLDSESGLQYYRARYFDNNQGRFINRDPIGYADGLNMYRGYFVVGGVDPSGLEDKKYNMDNTAKDYFNQWKENNPNRDKSKDSERLELFSMGCNGVVGLNACTGTDVAPEKDESTTCFNGADGMLNAIIKKIEMADKKTCKGKNCNGDDAQPYIFSIHLQNNTGGDSNKPDVEIIDKKNGRINISNWNRRDVAGKRESYDYGFYNPTTLNIEGATNHGQLGNQDLTGGLPMKMNIRSVADWNNEYTGVGGMTVWCAGCQSDK